MPRYFFDTSSGLRDRERTGLDLKDNDAARVQGIIYAGEVLRDEPNLLWDGSEFKVLVTGWDRELLLTISVASYEPITFDKIAND